MYKYSDKLKQLQELLHDHELEYDSNGKIIFPEVPDEYKAAMKYDRDSTLTNAEREFHFGVNGFMAAPESWDGEWPIDPTLEQLQARAEYLREVLEELISAHLQTALNLQD